MYILGWIDQRLIILAGQSCPGFPCCRLDVHILETRTVEVPTLALHHPEMTSNTSAASEEYAAPLNEFTTLCIVLVFSESCRALRLGVCMK